MSIMNDDNHTKIWFTNIREISPSYENVMDFGSKVERNNWFYNNHMHHYTYSNIQYDHNLTKITVKGNYRYYQHYDYLFFWGYGDDSSGTDYYYYFITDIRYNTKDTTDIYVQLDVWTTFWEMCNIQNCFIDRCHVPRWKSDGRPTENLQDEGLAFGEYEMCDSKVIFTGRPTFIVSSSVPIGAIPETTGGGIGDEQPVDNDSESWKSGKISSDGFRFIKGFEAYAPYKYQDSGGYWTIGYGVTKHGEPTLYNQLVAKQPVSEEECAKTNYDMLNQSYGDKILDTCKKMGITKQCQFDALVSVAMNSGSGSITGSNSLTKAIHNNPNDETTIRNAWENFKVTSNGVKQAGLVARRKQECNMYFGKSYEVRSIPKINKNGAISGSVTENNGNGWLPSNKGDSITNPVNEKEPMHGHQAVENDFGWFLIPVTGAYVSSLYGWRNCPFHGREFHGGIDLACAGGTSILADRDCTITQTGYHSSMGNYIYADANGIRSVYMHLKAHKCKQGDTVKRGDLIGLVGTTGSSTGNHLHWELRKLNDGTKTNPIPTSKMGSKY